MSEPKTIHYRGVQMIEGWPEKIIAAQQNVFLTLQGKPTPRVRYGEEHDNWGANEHACHGCAVQKGEIHVPGCDGEECPAGGGQLISCDCQFEDGPEKE